MFLVLVRWCLLHAGDSALDLTGKSRNSHVQAICVIDKLKKKNLVAEKAIKIPKTLHLNSLYYKFYFEK